MNNRSTLNGEARPEMDDLLHDYFQSEMPHPWPTFKAPKPMRLKTPASFWSRYSGRLALAACVALMVAGYLSLGGFFPRSQEPTGLQKATDNIGMRDKASQPKSTTKQIDDPMPMPIGNQSTK